MGYEDVYRNLKVKGSLVANSLVAMILDGTALTLGNEVVTGTGTASLTTAVTKCVNSGTGAYKFTVNLGTGTNGLTKFFKAQIASGSGALVTPVPFYDGTTVTLTDKQWLQLIFLDNKWNVVATNGTVA